MTNLSVQTLFTKWFPVLGWIWNIVWHICFLIQLKPHTMDKLYFKNNFQGIPLFNTISAHWMTHMSPHTNKSSHNNKFKSPKINTKLFPYLSTNLTHFTTHLSPHRTKYPLNGWLVFLSKQLTSTNEWNNYINSSADTIKLPYNSELFCWFKQMNSKNEWITNTQLTHLHKQLISSIKIVLFTYVFKSLNVLVF